MTMTYGPMMPATWYFDGNFAKEKKVSTVPVTSPRCHAPTPVHGTERILASPSSSLLPSRMACASFFSDLPPKFPVSSLLFFPSSQSLVPPSPRPSPPVAESNKPGLLLPKSSLAETSEGVTLLAFSVPLHWKRPAWSGRVEENRSFRFFFCL